MPSIQINLSLPELQVAVARYVVDTCGIEINAGSMQFTYEVDPGQSVDEPDGVRFDVVRNLPGVVEPSANGHAAEFALIYAETNETIATGRFETILEGIRGNAGRIREKAALRAMDLEVGSTAELRSTRGHLVYRLQRLS